MGYWGYKGLESDDGLDIRDFTLGKNIPENCEFKLSEILTLMKKEGDLKDFNDEGIQISYDTYVIALVELFFMFNDNGKFDFGATDEKDSCYKLNGIKKFTADKKSLQFLHEYLVNIKNDIYENKKNHEIIEAIRDSELWDVWQSHLNELIKRLEKEINNI